MGGGEGGGLRPVRARPEPRRPCVALGVRPCAADSCGPGPEESPAAGGGRDRPGEARTAAARGRSLHRAYDSSRLCAGEQQAPGQTSGPSAQPSP